MRQHFRRAQFAQADDGDVVAQFAFAQFVRVEDALHAGRFRRAGEVVAQVAGLRQRVGDQLDRVVAGGFDRAGKLAVECG